MDLSDESLPSLDPSPESVAWDAYAPDPEKREKFQSTARGRMQSVLRTLRLLQSMVDASQTYDFAGEDVDKMTATVRRSLDTMEQTARATLAKRAGVERVPAAVDDFTF